MQRTLKLKKNYNNFSFGVGIMMWIKIYMVIFAGDFVEYIKFLLVNISYL